jgi:hypothetical protein
LRIPLLDPGNERNFLPRGVELQKIDDDPGLELARAHHALQRGDGASVAVGSALVPKRLGRVRLYDQAQTFDSTAGRGFGDDPCAQL